MRRLTIRHQEQFLRGLKAKGQAIVEMAMIGLFLAGLLAGAVDLGRAFYTAVVVANMAAEGASYGAINPDKDVNYPAAGTCSELAVDPNNNIQDRARQVAKQRGLVIKNPSQASIVITPADCRTRVTGTTITIKVTYLLDDLFLPGLLGFDNIPINSSASQYVTVGAFCADNPDSCTP